MDFMLQIRLIALGGFTTLYGLALGVGIVLSRLMHRRECRRSALHAAVVQQVPPEIRDRIETQVQYPYFGHRSLVNILMGSCSAEEVWRTITRLSESLSPKVRLLVYSTDMRLCPVTLTVKPSVRPPRNGRSWR
jgi:hypothetical protein